MDKLDQRVRNSIGLAGKGRWCCHPAGQTSGWPEPMPNNPAVPSSVGTRLEAMCRSCGNRGMTVKGIDNERQFAFVQCDVCRQIASVDMKWLFGPDAVVDRQAPGTGGEES